MAPPSSAGAAAGKRGDATEQTPLLGSPAPGDSGSDAETLTEPPPPPSVIPGAVAPSASLSGSNLQILLLCFARLMEPIAFFCIIPFIAQMVQRNGNLPESDVGFYSGLIESLFSATQMLVLIFWGRLADTVGRKPVMLACLVGTAVCPALFGVARTLWQMIFFRCLAGVFSASTLIIRTMIAENSTAETQARAFSWFAFSNNLGIFIGPLLGGALANPAEQYGWKNKFFSEYPYALPGFATGGLSAIGAVIVALFLKETLKKDDAPAASSDGSGTPPVLSSQNLSIRQLLRWPGVAIVIWNYNHFMFMAFAYTAILPVVLYTDSSLGGIGFSTFQISMVMAIHGLAQALWLLVVFAPLQHRIGTKGTLRLCAWAYPFFFFIYIILNALLRQGTETARVWFWIIGAISVVVGPGISMSFTSVQLALNDVTPNAHVLGTLNAIALTVSSGVRAIVPGLATVVYAIGVRNQIVFGQLAWLILVPLAAALIPAVAMLPDDKPLKKRNDDEPNEQ